MHVKVPAKDIVGVTALQTALDLFKKLDKYAKEGDSTGSA